MRRPASTSERPYASCSPTTDRNTSCSQVGARKRLTKPGPRDLDLGQMRAHWRRRVRPSPFPRHRADSSARFWRVAARRSSPSRRARGCGWARARPHPAARAARRPPAPRSRRCEGRRESSKETQAYSYGDKNRSLTFTRGARIAMLSVQGWVFRTGFRMGGFSLSAAFRTECLFSRGGAAGRRPVAVVIQDG